MSTEQLDQEQQKPTAEEQQKTPSKEEIIAFFQEQIEVKKYQAELQELNTRLAVNRAEELKALSFIAQITDPTKTENAYKGGMPHTITQEDLDANPELVEEGLKVGDEVIIPAPVQEKQSKRNLKK